MSNNDNNNWRVPETRVSYNNEDESINILAELPGIAKEDLDLKFLQNKLTIKGETGDFRFRKVFVFRDEPDIDHIEANFDLGLLKLVVRPKQPEVIKIPVK